MSTAPRPSFARTAGLTLAGLLIWAAHLTFVYGFTGLACARPTWGLSGDGPDATEAAVAAATLAAALAIFATIVVARRAADAFSRWLSISISLLALVAVGWAGMTVVIVPACA